MAKLKPLLPSLKEKKRYISFEVISKEPLLDAPVFDAISLSALKLLGEQSFAKAGVMILKDKWDKDKQQGIVRVGNRYSDHLRASFALIKTIDNKEVIVRSLSTSGILKKLNTR